MNHRTVMACLVVALASACEVSDPEAPASLPPAGGTTSGDENNTFDHDNSGPSPWELVDRITREGPPRYTSRVHGCTKIKYETLGTVLRSLGVDVDATGEASAGRLYRDGDSAMAAANYPNRIRENVAITTSGASRLFDIFAAAAPEVITALPSLARCALGGQPAVLFDASNRCQATGLTCLMGVPATPTHVEICNLTVTSASNPELGKRLAVAAILAAAHTCE